MALTAITKDFITRSGVQIQGTQYVTSSTGQVGALQVNSGAAIAKNLIVGTTSSFYGPATFYGDFSVQGTTNLGTISVSDFTATNLTVTNTANINKLSVTTNASVGGTFTVTNGTSLLSTLDVTGTTTLTGQLVANNTSTFNAPVVISGSNTLTVGTGTTTLGGATNIGGPLTINSNLTASSAGTGSGALKVVGGIYVGDNLIVNSTAADTGTKTANSLYVNGGAWIDKTLVVNGDTTFSGVVTFNGTATYVLSTNTVYTDNIIHLHENPGGVDVPWTVDDGKDVGLVFHYYKGADKNAFLGFANDSGYLEWYNDGEETGGVYVGSSYGTFKTSDIMLVGTTNAANTTSGALQVAGGIGLGGAVYAGGNLNGATITARNLTDTRIVIAGTGGQLTDDGDLTWNAGANQIEGRIAYANTSTNIAGGAQGGLLYQSAADTTAILPIGTSSYVLTSNGTVPTWAAAGSTTVGASTTATNLAGGAAGYIPFQSGSGTTTFDSLFTYVDSTNTLNVDNIAVTTAATVAGAAVITTATIGNYGVTAIIAGTDTAVAGTTGAITVWNTSTLQSVTNRGATTNNAISITNSSASTGTTSGALTVAGGVGIAGDLYVGGNIYLDGVGLDTIQGTTGTFVNVAITGTGVAFTVTNSIYVGGNSTLATVTATNISVTGTLSVSGQTTLGAVNAGVFTATSIASSGKVIVSDNTNALATNQGSIQTLGGIGVAKDVFVGGLITSGAATAGSGTVVAALVSNNLQLASYTSNTLTGNSTANLDTWSATTFRTARYTMQVVDGSDIHITEITLFHNGTNVYLNEYGISTNNGELGTFDAELTGGNVILKFTPTSATAMTIKVIRMSITA
jgi:hypothetical protein